MKGQTLRIQSRSPACNRPLEVLHCLLKPSQTGTSKRHTRTTTPTTTPRSVILNMRDILRMVTELLSHTVLVFD